MLASLLALAVAAVGQATADVAVYQAVVPSPGPGESERVAGFGEALRVVAVRASGRRDAASNGMVKSAAAAPTSYVQQYATTSDRMLRVGFDPIAIENLLQKAGLPVWAQERPTVLVVLPASDTSARPTLEAAAQGRGVALAWPQSGVDPAEARVRLADGDVARLGGASGAVLVGAAAGEQVEWTFAHAGEVTRARGGLALGIDLAADTLATRYATPATRGVTRQTLRVNGVADVESYAGLMNYLGSLSMVRAVAVEELAGDTVTLGLTLRGDLELLRRFAALEGRLQPAPAAADGTPPVVDFRYLQ